MFSGASLCKTYTAYEFAHAHYVQHTQTMVKLYPFFGNFLSFPLYFIPHFCIIYPNYLLIFSIFLHIFVLISQKFYLEIKRAAPLAT